MAERLTAEEKKLMDEMKSNIKNMTQDEKSYISGLIKGITVAKEK